MIDLTTMNLGTPSKLGKRPDKPAKWQLELEKELAEMKVKLIKSAEWMAKYREENRIEFFDKPPNPGPNPRQKDLLEAWMDSRYRVFTFTGSNRSGKTVIGTLLAISTCLGEFPWSGEKLQFRHTMPRKIRWIGQDWHNHIEKVLIPELRKWWPKRRKVTCKGNGIISDTLWKDEKTGSTIEIMSNLQDSDTHEGWNGDLIIYDEPPKRNIRIANARGLVDRNGRELFCMTLLKEAWVNQEVINARLEDGRPDPTVFNVHADIWVNVGYGITKEGVDQFAKTLTDVEKKARLDGIPSYMSGLVLPQFKRNVHLVDRFKIPLDWIVDVAMDVHPREKQAALFIATDPKNERYLVNEIWDHGDGTWLGEEVVRCMGQYKYRPGRFIIDPLAKGDQNNTNTTFDKVARVLYAHGYPLETATKDKRSGILEIQNHLLGPNKKPSLFIFNDLVRTIWEIEGWLYDEDSQKPVDANDHFCENLYRLLLLNTQWYPVEWMDDDDRIASNSGRSKYGGY